MEIKGIKYTAPVLNGSGYAKAARGYIMALHKLGVPITINPVSFETARPDLGEEGKILESLIDKDIDYNINFIHLTPEFYEKHREPDKINCAYTVWENSKLHKSWPAFINNNVDKVITGSKWGAEIFKESGVTIPVGVLSHCMSVEEFENVDPYQINGVSDSTFVFYDVYQFCEKKSPLDAIKTYWATFQNDEDVALVIKTYRDNFSEEEKDAIRRTVKRIKAQMPMDKYPPIYLILDMLSEEQMVALHNRGNCLISLNKGEGVGLCIASNTNILVPDGIKRAKDINVNDEVLSVDGNFHKITGTSKRYVENGLCIKARIHEPIVISKEHPFLAARLSKHERYNSCSSDLENLLNWTVAKNLDVGDYVAFPKPKSKPRDFDVLDILSFVSIPNINILGNSLNLKMGYSPKDKYNSYTNLVNKYGLTKKIFERAVNHIKNGTTPRNSPGARKALNILKTIDYEPKKSISINRYVEISDEVLYLFGWYLAEGSNHNGRGVEVDLHRKEYHIAVELSKIFINYFGVPESSIILEKYENKSRLVIVNKILGTLFSALFGKGAYNKHIPEFLFMNSTKLKPLLKGLFYGDGYDSGKSYELCTVSPSLAYQTKYAFNAMGYCPRLSIRDVKGIGNYPQYFIDITNNDYCKFFDVSLTWKKQRCSIETDNFFLVRVYEIETIEYNDYMYDFSVADAESFVGNGLLLHNCPLQAAAYGNPIIITGWGGSLEYAKPDLAYLVNFFLEPVFGMNFSPWHNGTQWWAKADLKHASDLMLHVYNNKDEAAKRGLKLQEHIRDNFSYEVIGKKLIKELEDL